MSLYTSRYHKTKRARIFMGFLDGWLTCPFGEKNEVLSGIRIFIMHPVSQDQCNRCGSIRLNFTPYSLTNYRATSVLKFWVQILFLASLFLNFWEILFTGLPTAESIRGIWTTETVCRPETGRSTPTTFELVPGHWLHAICWHAASRKECGLY